MRRSRPMAMVLVLALLSLLLGPLTGGGEAATVLARAMQSLKPYQETGGLLATPWPAERGDVHNRGRSPYTGPAAPRLVRATPAPGSVVTGAGETARVYFQLETPVLGPDGGSGAAPTYTGSAAGLVALAAGAGGDATAATGQAGWLVRSPVLARLPGSGGEGVGVAYVAAQEPASGGFSEQSRLYALPLPLTPAAVRGDWAAASMWPAYGVPGAVAGLTAAADGAVYITTSAGYLYALDPPRPGQTTGGRWRLGPDRLGEIQAPPALGLDGTIYVASGAGKLHAVTRAGEVKWEAAVTAPVLAAPMVAEDGAMYVGDGAGRLHAFWPGGRTRWSVQLGSDPLTGGVAAGADGTLYVGDTRGTLYAVDAAGRLRWRLALDAYLSAPVVDAAGTVYAGSAAGRLYAVGSDGKLRWEFNPAALPPEWVARYGPLRLTQPALASTGGILGKAAGDPLVSGLAMAVGAWADPSFRDPTTALTNLLVDQGIKLAAIPFSAGVVEGLVSTAAGDFLEHYGTLAYSGGKWVLNTDKLIDAFGSYEAADAALRDWVWAELDAARARGELPLESEVLRSMMQDFRISLAAVAAQADAGAVAGGVVLGQGPAVGAGSAPPTDTLDSGTESTPPPTPAATPAARLAAGGDYSLTLKADGTVWAWGSGGRVGLGDGTTDGRLTPVRVLLP